MKKLFLSKLSVNKLCVHELCVSKLCLSKLRVRKERREAAGVTREGGSAQPKTRTPYKDLGNKWVCRE